MMLEVYKGLSKAASALIVQILTKKIGLKKFLYSKKVLSFNLPECPYKQGLQSPKHLLVKCIYTLRIGTGYGKKIGGK